MRQIASILLCGIALSAGAAEVWRWKDANGVVHYSDNPVPGAVRVTVNVAANSGAPQEDTGETSSPPPPPRAQPFSYNRCEVDTPRQDETFQGVQSINISVQLDPGLQPEHRIQVTFDGAPLADWAPDALSYAIPEVYRGAHTLVARILDSGGRAICTGRPTTFHVQQPGLLSPNRQVKKP
jgi:hypothetical protein